MLQNVHEAGKHSGGEAGKGLRKEKKKGYLNSFHFSAG
jgi:hypothetical protein